MQIEIAGEILELLPEKAVYWASKKSLFLSDLHLGKVNHFRKAGMAVPQRAGMQTLENLEKLLMNYAPEQVYFLGDLFHSVYNKDWDRFIQFRKRFAKAGFHLIEGNHDILEQENWNAADIILHRQKLELSPFSLVHDPIEEGGSGYKIAGHIHPCIRISGAGKQTMRIPCFWKSETKMVLPSFGSFTGMHPIKAKKGDEIYLVTADRIVLKRIESEKKE
jgi:DNA ligase-associated metallophosphoesterase